MADDRNMKPPATPGCGNELVANRKIADLFDEAARLLEQQGADYFRVSAYRRGAQSLRDMTEDVTAIAREQGSRELQKIPGIGVSLASAIEEIARTGQWAQIARWRGELDAEHLFRTVPGIGAVLSKNIHDTLGIDTLPELEVAAHDGRLSLVPGVGTSRAASIAYALDGMLSRFRATRREPKEEPSVQILLMIDRLYNERAQQRSLPTIAPKRFNPKGEKWLPILHHDDGGWHFTALFSNTARAHELGRTNDWVVIYFYNDGNSEGQRTIVTERQGPLKGKRVIRGREKECSLHYASAPDAASYAHSPTFLDLRHLLT